ncbi:MAG: phytanoyl-CoA dioxygenase family protein [Deltaproteobacteria bacterium]|nr:phytanoyl-CoA dioxygenase family protein [Deltaproteobacteria bacterium]
MSVDFRTRVDPDQQPVEAGRFFGEDLPAKLDAHQGLIAPGGNSLRLNDLCIEVEGEPWTLRWHGDRASVEPGNGGAAHVRLTAEQLSDLANDQTTPVAFMSSGTLDMPSGRLADFLDWWLVLRGALDGCRIHAAGDVSLETRVPRSFDVDDSDEDMRAFLEEAGYLHIRGLFSKEEMAAVEADYPKAAPHFEKGDRRAWFATTNDGAEHLVRMEGFDAYSDASVQLIDDDRFQRIGRIPGLGHVQRRKPGARIGALDKPIGVVKGISDVPWHKDCSLGRHSYECCSLTVGISVTGADAESGQLRVVPGSHRALIWPAPCLQPGLDLEPVDLPTETGDVTVHLSCTLHMSQPPVERSRKVLYMGFAQRPVDVAAAEAQRQKLHDVRGKAHTTVSQEPGYLGDPGEQDGASNPSR